MTETMNVTLWALYISERDSFRHHRLRQGAGTPQAAGEPSECSSAGRSSGHAGTEWRPAQAMAGS